MFCHECTNFISKQDSDDLLKSIKFIEEANNFSKFYFKTLVCTACFSNSKSASCIDLLGNI